MRTSRLLPVILATACCSNSLAQDLSILNNEDPQLISYKLVENQNNDWISVNSITSESQFTWSSNTTDILSEEIALAWNFKDFLSVNINVFENKYTSGFDGTKHHYISNNKSFNKSLSLQQPSSSLDINRRLIGYKFGVSSELELGEEYKLDINLDYGQLAGADLAGFTSNEVNTSSFELGIRTNKFGASFNTDLYHEKNIDLMQNSRLGLELDWYFSKDTTFSVGSKQRVNDKVSQSNYLDSLTGNVQYIKFQHNL